ncbi:hypothetical protein ACEQPO_07240 [Bacillus sp. SL00103]
MGQAAPGNWDYKPVKSGQKTPDFIANKIVSVPVKSALKQQYRL